MTSEPLVSVVMSVYNDAETLAATMDSILTQEGLALEFIVVDDGSVDGSGAMLDDYAQSDERVRVIHQENTGLTRALMRGCAAARGKYIARQDAGGDISLPGRLHAQKTVLEQHPHAVLTSCATQFVGPGGESLYVTCQHGDELHRGLLHLTLEGIKGPSHHGSTMFRADAYRSVGGYRMPFRVAQDLDLWSRFVEIGQCTTIPDVYYQASLRFGSISSDCRGEQIHATRLILQAATNRRAGMEDSELLEKALSSKDKNYFRTPRRLRESRFFYFLASILRTQNSILAHHYYAKSLSSWPFHVKALLGLLWTRNPS